MKNSLNMSNLSEKLPVKMSRYCLLTERIPDQRVGPNSIFSN